MNETEEGMGYDKELIVKISCHTKDCYTNKSMGLYTVGFSNN
jgi:hypothetical protein